MGIWSFVNDFSNDIENQYNIMKKYADLVSIDTEGKFTGKVISDLEKVKLTISNKNKPDHNINVFMYLRNKYTAYPITVNFLLKSETINKTVNNNEELEAFLIKCIESEETSQVLFYLDKMFEKHKE